jgi:hypothetical protein
MFLDMMMKWWASCVMDVAKDAKGPRTIVFMWVYINQNLTWDFERDNI